MARNLPALMGCLAVALMCGCPLPPPGGDDTPPPTASYIGSSACGTCHGDVAALTATHGHRHTLKTVLAAPPQYPSASANAGVPQPPDALAWTDIAYVVDGYSKAAWFVDRNGFMLTDTAVGGPAQYNLPLEPFAVPAGFASFRPDATAPLPFDFETFRRLTTGAQSLANNGGLRQDGRTGIEGTWAEPGVTCEACHGPGSNHPQTPRGGTIIVDSGTAACTPCHQNPNGPGVPAAADLLIQPYQQVNELAVSPHAGFACNVCHDPHTSSLYGTGVRNQCQGCHSNMNLARHEGLVFTRDGYSEPLDCTSCHMPYIVRTAQSVDVTIVGESVRFGDTQSHIFAITTDSAGIGGLLTADRTAVMTDASGKAAVPTCFVCQRCHNGQGNAFAFPADEGCNVGRGLHGQ